MLMLKPMIHQSLIEPTYGRWEGTAWLCRIRGAGWTRITWIIRIVESKKQKPLINEVNLRMPLMRAPSMWSSRPIKGPPQISGNCWANWEIVAAQPTGGRQVAGPMRLGAIPLVDDPAELRPLGPRVLDSTQSLTPGFHLGIPSCHPTRPSPSLLSGETRQFHGQFHVTLIAAHQLRIKLWWDSASGRDEAAAAAALLLLRRCVVLIEFKTKKTMHDGK